VPDAPGSPGAIRAVYEAKAAAFDRLRSRALLERPWLDRVHALVPARAPHLDLGCGTGEPSARHQKAAGPPVTGVDVAEPMLASARARLPEAAWLHADMRGLDLDRRFGGIVAWDSFFHLTRDDQRAMFPVFARHLAPGGALLFTSGPQDGEAVGAVDGAPVYHASLSPAAYAGLLEANGLAVRAFVAEDPDCDRHTVWLARMS
jgi:SAM-dependent methyltransferase